MKLQFIVNLVITIIITSQGPLSGQKFYLSPTGNDSNPGTIDRPVSSLVRARDLAREFRKSSASDQPVEIIAMGGEYSMLQPLVLSCPDGGKEDSPLIIKGEMGKKAIFRGGIRVTGWEQVNERLWKAFIPQVAYYDSYFEQLFVNGRRATRARTPNEGFLLIKGVEETVLENGGGRSPLFAVQKILLDSTNARCFTSFSRQDYDDAIVTFYHKWDNTRKRVKHFNSKESAIYTVGTGMKPWNSLDKQTRYFVDNYKEALDAPGEWHLDRSGWLWYIPVEGETLANFTAYAPVISEFISVTGDPVSGKYAENIRFENLVFEVAGYRTPPDGNEPAQAASPVDAVIILDNARNIVFSDCEIAHTGTYAFWFRKGCSNCTVNRCYLHDLGAGGIKIGETTMRSAVNEITNNITADNNIITDGGHIFPCAVGIIIFHASDNRLIHNEISNLRYSGISVGWIWGYAHSPSKRNIVRFNHIHHLGWGELCDMGGVYTLGASEGTIVSDNLIHHVYSYDYGGWGLYTDEGSFGITMENNLVYACKNSGFHQHYGKENIIRNNIFASNMRAQLQATRVEEHSSLSFTNNIVWFNRGSLLTSNWHKFRFVSDYNCYWDTRTKDIRFAGKSLDEWKKEGKDIHSIIADPMFVNPSEWDFRFKNLSVARKMKFKPFDYSKAGVYGSDEWRKLAATDRDVDLEFERIVEKNESRMK